MNIKNKTDKNLKLEVFSICPGSEEPIYGTLILKEGKEVDTEFPMDELRIKIQNKKEDICECGHKRNQHHDLDIFKDNAGLCCKCNCIKFKPKNKKEMKNEKK